MTNKLSIGIAGCGIGGLTTALFLRRNGHDVTLFDQFDTPAPVGSGLVIQPVGQAVLDELGLGVAAQHLGQKIYKMYGTESGPDRAVLNVDYGQPDSTLYGLGMHRADLFGTLYEAVKNEQIPIIQNSHIQSSTIMGTQRSLTDSTGQTHGPFDLVIDAMGASSTLSPIKTRPLAYGALWGTVDWPAETDLPDTRLSQCYKGAHHMLGVLPLGHSARSGTRQAAIFWSLPSDQINLWPEQDIDAWKRKTVKLWPAFAPFVSQITGTADMICAQYSHGTLSRPYDTALAFIGDAAHQASPQLGQGANMALLDARALSQALERSSTTESALRRYARRRALHVYTYQLFSAIFTPFYQSDSRFLPLLRNYVLNPASRIWPIRYMLTRLVCGNFIRPSYGNLP